MHRCFAYIVRASRPPPFRSGEMEMQEKDMRAKFKRQVHRRELNGLGRMSPSALQKPPGFKKSPIPHAASAALAGMCSELPALS